MLLRTTLSTNKQFFASNPLMDPATENRVGEPLREIPLQDRQLISDAALRKSVEKYSGVSRYKTGKWLVDAPTMTRTEFRRTVIQLKDSNHRALSSFLDAVNENGTIIQFEEEKVKTQKNQKR